MIVSVSLIMVAPNGSCRTAPSVKMGSVTAEASRETGAEARTGELAPAFHAPEAKRATSPKAANERAGPRHGCRRRDRKLCVITYGLCYAYIYAWFALFSSGPVEKSTATPP